MEHSPSGAYDALVRFLYQSPIGLLQTTLDGEITMINPMSAQLLMPLARDGDLLNLFDVLLPMAPQLRTLAAAVDADGGTICEGLRIELPAADPGRGESSARTLAISLTRLDHETLVCSVTDVTATVQREQQRLRLKLRDASRIDALTALPNRSVAMERIGAALETAARDPGYLFAVLCINCDRFDRLNAMLGTPVGDELLRMVGGRLNGTVRSGDGVGTGAASSEPAAARLGADEFVLVVHGMREPADAHGVAQRVVDALARPYAIRDQIVHLTASVGVVLRSQAMGDADEVLQNANTAMHAAKRAGGARYGLFDPAMKARAARLGSVESELRPAIAGGQLFVVYQPIVTLGTHGQAEGCSGVEALVRWRHPARGIVPPIEFIEIAEETGLIGALGQFVLGESCRQFVRWRRELGAAAPQTLSVNLSRAQLLAGGFKSELEQLMKASGMPPEALQLEVTESLAAQDASIRTQLHELKALGITLALDDFGTGYSSLSSLHQLPVDVVKIDRSFVSQLESSAHHRVLVEATVKVAQSLGMRTVAEGIETHGQAVELARLQCGKAQGYLFARPMAAGDVTGWLLECAGEGVAV